MSTFVSPQTIRQARVEQEAALWRQLRAVIGYVENGTGKVVTIFQDDATRDWTIKVGTRTQGIHYGSSLSEALAKAYADAPDENK